MAHRFGVVVSTILFAGFASAEIYKWVDEDGKVHFGDQPLDPVKAEQAERVEIRESYQPSTLSSEEQASFEEQQAALRRKTEMYRREDAEKREAELAERRKKNEARCDALQKKISRLSEMKVIRGVRTYYYATNEDGKPVSSARQREIIAELKAQYEEAGCS